MTIFRRLSTWMLIAAATGLLAISWVTTALAEADGDDGDGLDGDDMGLPILLGVAVLVIVGALAFQRFSSKPRN